MEAIKLNKVYTVNEETKDRYLAMGYDIYENGECIEHSPLATVPWSKYQEALDEIAELKAKLTRKRE